MRKTSNYYFAKKPKTMKNVFLRQLSWDSPWVGHMLSLTTFKILVESIYTFIYAVMSP